MSSLINSPLTVVAKVSFGTTTVSTTYSNPGNPHNGAAQTFLTTLKVTPQLTSSYSGSNLIQYDGRNFAVGMWVGFPGGFTYRIKQINSVNPTGTVITLILEDKDLLNLIVDNSTLSNNHPPEEINGIVFNVDDDGMPILYPLDSQRGSLNSSAPTYWIFDIENRFRLRNYFTNFFQIDPNYASYAGINIGDFVYLNGSGLFIKSSSSSNDEIKSVFGIVTASDTPSTGNLNVRPLGRIITNLPTLPGSVGQVLYFDSTQASNLNPIPPSGVNLFPVYIKINNTTGLLLSRSGGDGSIGPQGFSGDSGTSGSSGSNGTSGSSGIDGSSGTSGTGSPGTSGSSGTSGTGSPGTSGSSGSSGAGSSGTSGSSPSSVFSSDITVSLSGGKTLGRYTTGQSIPSNGKTPQEVITLLAQEALAPTVSLTSSTTIAFNQTAISNALSFSYTINSLGATVSTASLEWRRNGTGAWTVLSSGTTTPATFTHTLTDSAFNTQAFNYRYIVTDSAGGTNTATFNITPAAYAAPTITFTAPATAGLTSPESGNSTSQKRELGKTASTLQGSWSRNSANVPVSSYIYSVSINGGGYTNIGTSYSISGSSGTLATVSDTPATSTTTSITYRIVLTDSYTTTTKYYDVTLVSMMFYGDIDVATTVNSAAIRALPSRKFPDDGVDPFTFSSGTTNRRWIVAMINTYSLSAAQDITQNVNLTSNFGASSVSVNDAAGNAKTYNVYTYTNAIPYNPAITIQITY